MNKVDVVVERQWHIGPHAAALAKMGCLGHVYGGFPSYRYRALGMDAKLLRTNCLPAVWNQMAGKLKLRQLTADAPKILADWVARQKDLNRYINCYSTVYRHLFPMLRERILVIERGSMFPEDYFFQIQKGKREAGLSHSECLPKDLSEEIEASKLAHFISVGSKKVMQGYVERGYDPERILMVPYGIDADLFVFAIRSSETTNPLRMALVGMLGIRKGLLRFLKILDWAGRRSIPMQGVLIGPLEPEAKQLLQRFPGLNVELRGVLKGAFLVNALHECDLYCIPSYEEGFPISMLEAMSTGLPAIVSSDTGAAEAIEEGVSGFVLKDFSDTELDQNLTETLRSLTRLRAMGRTARERIETTYALDHYCARLRSEYQRMFDIVEAAGGNPPPAWR